ncbi:MAG: hypothetical protein COB50_05350 [Thiotrichales bacterium]|nr:MAG: hypothetical protein COB50_05350 [Thiotrichales bacterium]
MPWQRTPHTRVLVEISMDEQVIRTPLVKKIIHIYGEPINDEVKIYALEEIIAEKLRAILQHIATLENRGWSRSRARDYYDLWRIFNAYKQQINFTDFLPLLKQKCDSKNVSFKNADDFFQKEMLAYVKKTWQQWLEQLVPDLPTFDTVIEGLRPQISELLDK